MTQKMALQSTELQLIAYHSTDFQFIVLHQTLLCHQTKPSRNHTEAHQIIYTQFVWAQVSKNHKQATQALASQSLQNKPKYN